MLTRLLSFLRSLPTLVRLHMLGSFYGLVALALHGSNANCFG